MKTQEEKLNALISMAQALDIDPRLITQHVVSETPTPTLSDYLVVVRNATSLGAAKTYETYWQRLESEFGDRQLSNIRVTDLEAWLNNMTLTQRRSEAGGYAAQRSALQATRKIWSCAVRDGLIDEKHNVPAKIPMPRRKPTARRALTGQEVTELFDFVASSGGDPKLDSMIIRFGLESGCRRQGLLALRRDHLNSDRQTAMLREKGDIQREVPVTAAMMASLVDLHASRSGDPTGEIFRYRSGEPLSRKRFETLFSRVQAEAGAQLSSSLSQVSFHWLRHTAGTLIRSASGDESVAAEFLGHLPARSAVTRLYTAATTQEVAQAFSKVWGEDHPLI